MTDTKILIVEDEGIEALDIQHRLANLGYELPQIAFSGEEAVRMAEEIRPDLVLMDIMLHGEIDGVEAARLIKACLGIPIIYLTAYANEDIVQRAKLTDPYGYIVKPFKERELHIAIEMALYKHRMEKQLKESKEWFATTLRSIGDAAIATDNNGLITFMNVVAENLTGWKVEEALNKNLTDVFRIINRDTRRTVENPVERVLVSGTVVGLANHTLLIAKDGTEVPIDDSAAPIKDDRGNIIGVILVFRDVTEREEASAKLQRANDELEKRVAERTADLEMANRQLKKEIEQRRLAEQRLQEKNIELEKANLAKDRFLASMSHELRTPLNAIIGFTGTLLMKLPGPLTPEQEKQLKNISISAKHLLSLINDILDLAKIESGGVELNLEPVSCHSIIRDIADTLSQTAESKGLKFVCDLTDNDVIIRTDRRALCQILINLVSNAIKFTDTGMVRIELRDCRDDGCRKVLFNVIDTGMGIKPDDRSKLFDAFSRVGTAGHYSHDGTGLGLHLSNRLAELLGGRIVFHSEFGKGSVFTLMLDEQNTGGEQYDGRTNPGY
jgi:PAS domain S-box-containing protein